MKERLQYVDFAKGIAIMLVIVGHICRFNMEGASAEIVWNSIASFFMPLFFFLSGFVAAFSRDYILFSNLAMVIKKKVVSLLVPFVVWGVIVYLLFGEVRNFEELLSRIANVFIRPDSGAPWFLVSLFVIQIDYFIFCIVSNLFNKKLISEVLVASAILLIITGIRAFGGSFFYFNIVYSTSFFVGYFIYRLCGGNINKWVVFISFVLLVRFAPQFSFESSPNYVKLLLGMMASLVVMYLSREIVKYKGYIMIGKLSWIGRHTMEIYVAHFCIVYFVYEKIDSSCFYPIPLFLILLPVSYIIAVLIIYVSKVMSTLPYMGLLLFGKRK